MKVVLKSLVGAAGFALLLQACTSGSIEQPEPEQEDAGTTPPQPIAGDGPDAGSAPKRVCTDALSLDDCGDLRALILPAELPAARGNEHADSFDAAILGFRVYFDARFSSNLKVRCESCHSVDHAFGDNQQVPIAGVGKGVRNSPTIFNAARHQTHFWDGRIDSLWSQPLLAFENVDEMNFTRLEIVHLLNAIYTLEYEKAFGKLFDFSDMSRFPARGKPGDAAYDAMAAADKLEVNRAVANLGKALEAYMRNVATGPSAVDRYLAAKFKVETGYDEPGSYSGGDADAGAAYLTERQVHGLAVFVNAGCMNCHSGSQLSDDALHNIGVPALPGQAPDEGLSAASLREFEASPFTASGPFYEGGNKPAKVEAQPLGAFRTPSLRNLGKSAPYGHNGVFATLEEVVDFHLEGGGKKPGSFVGEIDEKLTPHPLSAEDRAALLEFLQALKGDYPKLPWGQWPSGNG